MIGREHARAASASRRPPRAWSQALRLFVGTAVVGLSILVGADSGEAQTLRGVLSDRDTYEPIDVGTVVLADEALDTLAQRLTEGGYFEFRLPESGEYYVIATALGYRALRSEPVWVGADETRVVEIAMESRPVPVEGLVVEAVADEPELVELRPTGFYDRMALDRGEFLTPGQIQRSRAKWPQGLFWGTETIRVHQSSHERPGIWNDVLVIPNRYGSGYCRPSIYVDGLWIRAETMGEGESLADIVSKDDILGVEMYEWDAGAPYRYPGKQSCGVVLIWTRWSGEGAIE